MMIPIIGWLAFGLRHWTEVNHWHDPVRVHGTIRMRIQKSLRNALLSLGTAFWLQAGWGLPADSPSGERLFQLHCAGCHGPKGEGGKGPNLALSRVARKPNDAELIEIITDGIDGTEMPTSRLDEAQIRQVAAFVRQLGVLPRESVSGNARQGEQLYSSKGCAQCHAIKGRGGASGPDLTEIGLRRGAAYLRAALTEPEADVAKGFSAFNPDGIPENFLVVRVTTRSGQRLTGVRVNEDTFSIQLRDSSDRLHSFFKSDLSELQKDWGKSPMPSYREVFSNAELNDVVAFLVSLGREQ